jgi:hypothetical protein
MRRFGLVTFSIQLCDAVFQVTDCFAPRLSLFPFSFLHQGAYLAAGGVAFGVELIGFSDDLTPLGVGLREIIQGGGRHAALSERGAHSFEIFPDVVEIEH